MVFLITNTLRGYESLFSLKEKMNFELNIYITKKKERRKGIRRRNRYRDDEDFVEDAVT